MYDRISISQYMWTREIVPELFDHLLNFILIITDCQVSSRVFVVNISIKSNFNRIQFLLIQNLLLYDVYMLVLFSPEIHY